RKLQFDAAWLMPAILGVVAVGLLAGTFFFLWRGKPASEPVKPLWLESHVKEATELDEALPAEEITADPPFASPAPIAALASPAVDGSKLPYFCAVETMSAEKHAFRIYFFPDELLFVDCGQTANTGSTASAIQEGLVGGLKEQVRRRQWQMNLTSPDEIQQMVDLSPHSFRGAAADVINARIEPPRLFERLDRNIVGWFRFDHRERGAIALQIQTMDDMRLATHLLPQAFGDVVAVNVELDRQSWRYVKRS